MQCRVLTACPRTLNSRDARLEMLQCPQAIWVMSLWSHHPAGTELSAARLHGSPQLGPRKRCSHCTTTRIISHSSPQPQVTSSTSLGNSWCLKKALVVFQWQEIEAFCRPSAAACVLSWCPSAPIHAGSTKPAEPRMGTVLLLDGSSSISPQQEGESCAPGVPVNMDGGSGTLHHQPWHGTDLDPAHTALPWDGRAPGVGICRLIFPHEEMGQGGGE